VSNTARRTAEIAGGPPKERPRGSTALRWLRTAGSLFIRQREATVFLVALLLFVYFGFISSAASSFFTHNNLVVLSQYAAPIVIIAIGEVLLLICGEIDLSPGYVYTFAPFLMHYLIDFWGVPALLAVLLSVLMGLTVGAVNAFFTVTVGVPSFITTLGTAFILSGLVLTTSHAFPAQIPASAVGIGRWLGAADWSMIIWAVILTAILHVVLTQSRWGLYTIASGGNKLGATEAGINVARIKYGNFMITGTLGALTGILVAFQTNTIDPSSGGFTPMFYSVTAAVIGGTAMLGGAGSILGAFFGAAVLAMLLDGFTVMGISANPLPIILGGAILVAMIANVQLARLREAGRA
jgi:simple sugar transport system permease protein